MYAKYENSKTMIKLYSRDLVQRIHQMTIEDQISFFLKMKEEILGKIKALKLKLQSLTDCCLDKLYQMDVNLSEITTLARSLNMGILTKIRSGTFIKSFSVPMEILEEKSGGENHFDFKIHDPEEIDLLVYDGPQTIKELIINWDLLDLLFFLGVYLRQKI